MRRFYTTPYDSLPPHSLAYYPLSFRGQHQAMIEGVATYAGCLFYVVPSAIGNECETPENQSRLVRASRNALSWLSYVQRHRPEHGG